MTTFFLFAEKGGNNSEMVSLYEILKAAHTGTAPDLFTALLGQKYRETHTTEKSGSEEAANSDGKQHNTNSD